MNGKNILLPVSHTLLFPDTLGDFIRNLADIFLEENNFLSYPGSRDVVDVRIHWHNFSSRLFRMFYFTTGERELAVFIFWHSVDEDSISSSILLQEKTSIEPYCLCMGSITIRENRFDEEFFIASHLTREEFDSTLDDLFLVDIHHRETITNFTLVLDISGKTEEQVSYGFNSYFLEFFYVGISSMEE